MGSQIAQQCALHGYQVNLTDVDEALLERAVASNRALLQNRVTKGRLSQEEADSAWQRVRPVKTLEDAAGQADFVIEAVFENLEVKQDLFSRLDKLCPPLTILASNSSSIVISKIAEAIDQSSSYFTFARMGLRPVINRLISQWKLASRSTGIPKPPATSSEIKPCTMLRRLRMA